MARSEVRWCFLAGQVSLDKGEIVRSPTCTLFLVSKLQQLKFLQLATVLKQIVWNKALEKGNVGLLIFIHFCIVYKVC